jgi:hypothetical protein
MAFVALAQDDGDAVGFGDGAGGGAEDVHDRVERARPRQPFDGVDQGTRPARDGPPSSGADTMSGGHRPSRATEPSSVRAEVPLPTATIGKA